MVPKIPLLFSFTLSSPTSKPQHIHDLCIHPLAASSPTQTFTTLITSFLTHTPAFRLLDWQARTLSQLRHSHFSQPTASQRTDK